MSKEIGWGFIGAGGITKRFIKGLVNVPDAYLAAVSSRTEKKVKDFANLHGATPYTDYKQVIKDENVDVIYVATPHSVHMENTLQALDYGKPVLCEKPMAPNADQVKKMVSKAREKKIFLMEGMWTRFFPVIRKVSSWLEKEEIGEVQYLNADFGFASKEDPNSRLFNLELAGGSLLDVGVYTVSFASMVFGKQPDEIKSLADMTSTGVDARMGCVFGYKDGGIASLFSAVRTNTPQEACIVGEKGYIKIPKFWSPHKAMLYKNGELADQICDDLDNEGFEYEIAAVHKDLREGKLENKLMPLDESIAIAETMDKIRKQWGLVYPFE